MSTLALRLAGPMQSWGDSSRFGRRETRRVPTKSGVLGLIAAAEGRRRSDPVEDLLQLRFGVRVDQPGRVLTDFHTAHTNGMDKPPTLSRRDYLVDAVFVALIEGDGNLLTALRDRLERPTFPLFLGRRSCPVEGRLTLDLGPGRIEEALHAVPWQASRAHAASHGAQVILSAYLDAPAGRGEAIRDVPLSYAPTLRRYGWRFVEETSVTVANRGASSAGWVDWLDELEG